MLGSVFDLVLKTKNVNRTIAYSIDQPKHTMTAKQTNNEIAARMRAGPVNNLHADNIAMK